MTSAASAVSSCDLVVSGADRACSILDRGIPGGAVIILTKHARDQMLDRGIRYVWIEATLLHPGWTRPDDTDPGTIRSFRAIADFGGRVLRVVHRQEKDDIIVVTVFFDRRARP